MDYELDAVTAEQIGFILTTKQFSITEIPLVNELARKVDIVLRAEKAKETPEEA